MSKDVSFYLDIKGGEEILSKMMLPTIKRRADAMAERARGMASGLTSKPPVISVRTEIGTIKRGVRAIAIISADGGGDPHSNYIGHQVLAKSKDAGRD